MLYGLTSSSKLHSLFQMLHNSFKGPNYDCFMAFSGKVKAFV